MPAFVKWLIEIAKLDLDPGGTWDSGFEVCFYRDYLWRLGKSAREYNLSPKRTFDFCLFGETDIVIIEAKCCGRFNEQQNQSLWQDKMDIPKLPGLERIQPRMVALASTTYFHNVEKHGRSDALSIFDGRITWQNLATQYDEPLFGKANSLYGKAPGFIN